MQFNLISWNVRGLNIRYKRRLVKSIVFDWKANNYCFEKTKLEGDITKLVNKIQGIRWIKYEYLEAGGTRKGILMMWDGKILKGEVLEITSYNLTWKFED